MRHQRARRAAALERTRRRSYRHERRKQNKGRQNEMKVGDALETLRRDGYIDSYFISTPNDARDRIGIDAGLTTMQGREIDFQIKSSIRGVQKHLQKHPEISCLNVQDCRYAPDVVRLIRKQFALSRNHRT